MGKTPLLKCLFLSVAVLVMFPLAVLGQADWPAAPTAADMLADGTVLGAIDGAWDDSQADDQDNRHEEGGWIIQCREVVGTETVYSYQVRRVPAGGQAGIAPGVPPVLGEDCRVVGFFHTHPNPPTDEDGNEWVQGPSDADKNWHNQHKIPGIVANATGNETFGPESGVYE